MTPRKGSAAKDREDRRHRPLVPTTSDKSPWALPPADDVKGDGETWEDYAHRLERRIKQQRDNLNELVALRGEVGDRKARKRIAHLERLLGQKELQLANQHDGLRALAARVAELEDAHA